MTDRPEMRAMVSRLSDSSFFEDDAFRSYFRNQIIESVRALLPLEQDDVVQETAQVWWENLVIGQTIDRQQGPTTELETEIIVRVIFLWELRDNARAAGVPPDPNGRLSIPHGLFP